MEYLEETLMAQNEAVNMPAIVGLVSETDESLDKFLDSLIQKTNRSGLVYVSYNLQTNDFLYKTRNTLMHTADKGISSFIRTIASLVDSGKFIFVQLHGFDVYGDEYEVMRTMNRIKSLLDQLYDVSMGKVKAVYKLECPSDIRNWSKLGMPIAFMDVQLYVSNLANLSNAKAITKAGTVLVTQNL